MSTESLNRTSTIEISEKKSRVIRMSPRKVNIDVLKKMGRPIMEIKEMKKEESVVCSLTGSPSDYNDDY